MAILARTDEAPEYWEDTDAPECDASMCDECKFCNVWGKCTEGVAFITRDDLDQAADELAIERFEEEYKEAA
jgi:hypothetical protein